MSWQSISPIEAFRSAPGIKAGRFCSTTLCLVPYLRAFASGRNFEVWLGLVPQQRSTAGRILHGGVTKMGQTDTRKGTMPDSWLGCLIARKRRMVAAVALANKMARNVCAMMTKEQNSRMA